jgi:hypothetical protein
MTAAEIWSYWHELESRGAAPDRWIGQGAALGIFAVISQQIATMLYNEIGQRVIQRLGFADRYEILESDAGLFEGAINFALNRNGGALFASNRSKADMANFLCRFGVAISPYSYQSIISGYTPDMPLLIFLRTHRHSNQGKELASSETIAGKVDDRLLDKVSKFVAVFEAQAEATMREWDSSLAPWSAVVESGTELFGHVPILSEIASMSAGIVSREERGKIGTDLFDTSVSLCHRARYARFRAGSVAWWRGQFAVADTEAKATFALICLYSWAAPSTIIGLDDVVGKVLEELDEGDWRCLTGAIRRAKKPSKSGLVGTQAKFIANSSALSLALMLLRAHDADLRLLYEAIKDYSGKDKRVLMIVGERALVLALETQQGWDKALPLVKRAYAFGDFEPLVGHLVDRTGGIPVTTARTIARDALSYPLSVLRLADSALAKEAGAAAKHVGRVASEERWFNLAEAGS